VQGVSEIVPGHPVTFLCKAIEMDAPFDEADISVVVSFRPSFSLWRKPPELYNFTVIRGSDGVVHWLPR
jgi:hypothetical protein